MEFKDFAGRLLKIYGGNCAKYKFVRCLFLSVVREEGMDLVEEYSEVTLRAYLNGNSDISGIAKAIMPYVDYDEFEATIRELPDQTIQLITEEFSDVCPDIDMFNAPEKLAYLFKEILEAAIEEDANVSSATTLIKHQNNVVQIGDNNVSLINNGEITINL